LTSAKIRKKKYSYKQIPDNFLKKKRHSPHQLTGMQKRVARFGKKEATFEKIEALFEKKEPTFQKKAGRSERNEKKWMKNQL
jgi:hypothetical protein